MGCGWEEKQTIESNMRVRIHRIIICNSLQGLFVSILGKKARPQQRIAWPGGKDRLLLFVTHRV